MLRRKVLGVYQRLSIHMKRDIDTEEREHCGSDVRDGGALCVYSFCAEKNTGNNPGIDAVITAPGLDIIFKNCLVHFSCNRIPGNSVSLVVADDQVRAVFFIRARRKFVSDEEPVDGY